MMTWFMGIWKVRPGVWVSKFVNSQSHYSLHLHPIYLSLWFHSSCTCDTQRDCSEKKLGSVSKRSRTSTTTTHVYPGLSIHFTILFTSFSVNCSGVCTRSHGLCGVVNVCQCVIASLWWYRIPVKMHKSIHLYAASNVYIFLIEMRVTPSQKSILCLFIG